MIKNEIKNKRKFFIERLNWKEKPFQQKGEKNQNDEDQIKKNNIFQIGIEGWNWKQIKISQNDQNKN